MTLATGDREWHVGLWHLPTEFLLWKSLTFPGEEVHANGAHDRRGTSAPRCLLACKNHPQSVFSHHLPQATGFQSPFGVTAPCKHLFVIQELSPPLISQTKPSHSCHKNQVTEYLQHDDLITEGLQTLQKPVSKPRQNSGVVIIKYPLLACSGWKTVSAVVIILPEQSLFSCMKWSMAANQGEKLGTAGIPRHLYHIRHFFGPQMNKETQEFQIQSGIFLKTMPKNFPLTSSGCWKQREIMWQEKTGCAITKKINCKCNNIQAFWWNILKYIALKRVSLFTDLF